MLEKFVNLTAPALTLGSPIAADNARRGSWPGSMLVEKALRPDRLNRWEHAPNANCDQVAALELYPDLKNWGFFDYHPMILADRSTDTRGYALLDDAQKAMIATLRGQLPTSTKPVFTADAPLETGSIVYLVGRGFNLGHVVTVLGVLQEPGKPLDYIVLEKPNPGLLPTKVSTLSEVFKQYPDTPIPPPTFNPTGAPLPTRPVAVQPIVVRDQFDSVVPRSP